MTSSSTALRRPTALAALACLLAGVAIVAVPGRAHAAPAPVYSVTQADAVTGDNPNQSHNHPQNACGNCKVPDPNGGANGVVDSYTLETFERPFNQQQDLYHPDLDIVSYSFGEDSEYYYFKITTFGPFTNQVPFYSWEIGRGNDPRGGLFIRADQPHSKNGNTFGDEGLIAFYDANNDVGGPTTNFPDGNGSGPYGYESKVFDQNGTNVQVRGSGTVTEFAAKKSFIHQYVGSSNLTHRAWIIKGGVNDPSHLYGHDQYNRRESGSPYPWLQQNPGIGISDCPNTKESNVSGSTRAALDSGTNQNTGIFNPCFPTQNIYEIDNGPWLGSPPPPPGAAIDIDKTGPATRNVGESALYTLTVRLPTPTNPPLSNVVVTDNKCNAAPVRQSGDDGDNVLEQGETWIYTCSRVIVSSDAPSVTNTATATGTPPQGGTVTDSDDHVVTVPAPGAAIDIDKTGPATRNVGQSALYTLTVKLPAPTNPPLTNVVVTDNKCNAAPVRQSGDDGDNVLEQGETWIYTCSRVIVSSDVPSVTNTATATGTPPQGGTVTDSDDHVVTVPLIETEPDITIDKSGPQEASVGDTITYRLKVSIPIDRPLHDVTVTDPKCDEPPALKKKTGGNQDAILELGEVWTYTCPHKVTASDPNPLPNTATVTGTDDAGDEVSDQDSHLVDIVPEPRVKIVKTGPKDAKVGDTITYTLEVSVPVDRPLHDVKVSDPKCDEAPKLKTKAGGDNDSLLELGEVWIYTCPHKVTAADVGKLKNVADVSGKDDKDKKVTDKDNHVVAVSQVKAKPPPEPPPPSGPLPFTGFEARAALWVALGLLASGGAALLGDRRHRRRRTL